MTIIRSLFSSSLTASATVLSITLFGLLPTIALIATYGAIQGFRIYHSLVPRS